MKVTFTNLNNNDTDHEIVFLSLTAYANNTERIEVLFDGLKYAAPVHIDRTGRRSFRHCGKVYDFEIA